jgi:hypothetical protein
MIRTMTALSALGLLFAYGCSDDEATSEDDGGTTSTTSTSSAGGATTSSGTGAGGGSGGMGTGGMAPECMSGTDAQCVACGAEICDATSTVCCSDGTTPACTAQCEEAWAAGCDGAEDCGSSQCCVVLDLFQNDPVGAVTSCGTCSISGGSSGINSVACRVKGDCAGISNGNGVPYSECCFAPEFAVGICVSQTSAYVDFGDNCNP